MQVCPVNTKSDRRKRIDVLRNQFPWKLGASGVSRSKALSQVYIDVQTPILAPPLENKRHITLKAQILKS